MTFEIKGLVDYRLDRVDTTGEGTSSGTPRHGCELVVFCQRMYQWWYGGFMVAASLAFRAGGQPEKGLLLAHH
jgi:hypothetical protein